MTEYSFNQAANLAGVLYGNLLGRVADKEGYDSLVDELSNGHSSVRDIVLRMLTSDEFAEKFVLNNTPNELAKRLRMALLKELRPKPNDIKENAIELLEMDWRDVVASLIDSQAYEKAFGEDGVPLIKYG
jgi:hypothetical protein